MRETWRGGTCFPKRGREDVGQSLSGGRCGAGVYPTFFLFFVAIFLSPLSFLSPPLSFSFPLSLPSSYKTLFLASSSFLTTSSGVLSSAFAIAALAAAGSDEKRSQRSPSTTCRDG